MSRFIVKQIKETGDWESFVQAQPFTLFVQSFHYGNFHESMGEAYWLFGVYDNEQLVAGALVVSVHAKRGNFLYLPYGPLVRPEYEHKQEYIYKELFSSLKGMAKKEGYAFIRISPFLDDTQELRGIFKRVGFRNAPMHVLAETTWLLDVRDDEEALLRAMNKNHRNLIRRCEREGVIIKTSCDPAALSGLDSLLHITADRHKFIRFSKEYIEKEFRAFAHEGQAMLFEAYLPDGTLDSAAIIMFYGSMAAYRHSASLGAVKQIPTSYALQWAVIQEAKKRGMTYYNFWGIAPDGATTAHPFHGITHFKKGFGGFQKDLLHCQDLPVYQTYWINWIVETIRRYKRGF